MDRHTGLHFLEDLLRQFDNWYVELEDCMRLVANKSKNCKRPRLEIQEIDLDGFKAAIYRSTIKAKELFSQLFELAHESGTYEGIAKDVLFRLSTAKKKYNLIDEHYRDVWDSVIKPIILLIMDEQDVTLDSEAKQDRRKLILMLLMDHEVTSVVDKQAPNMTVANQANESDENIDICDKSSDEASLDRKRFHNSCSLESMIIIEIIGEALNLFTQTVNREGVELHIHIYHIINIAYLTDLLKTKFSDIKKDLEEENEVNQRTTVVDHLRRTIDKLEDDMRDNYEKFPTDHPLAIFRSDLRDLLITGRVLAHVLGRPRG